MKKNTLINLLIVLGVILIAMFVITREPQKINEDLAKCIGENSVVYAQLGCHACKIQEEMFGDNYKYINSIDCFYNREKCENITATPTWIINEKTYVGVQSIETLQNLTGCYNG